MRKVLRHAGARVLDEELPVGTADLAFTPDDRLVVPELEERLGDLLAALVRETAAPLAVA